MSVTSGFFNSTSGDRTYNAEDLSKLFDGIITDGVFDSIGDAFLVIEGSGMQVIVGEGKAWFNHTWTINDSDLALSVDPSDIVLPRIDAVVLEVNSSDLVRTNTIKVITGTPASVPVEPAMIDTEEVHQYPLAYIAVGAGVSEILSGDITNVVGSYLCPYITVPQASNTSNGVNVLEVQVFS